MDGVDAGAMGRKPAVRHAAGEDPELDLGVVERAGCAAPSSASRSSCVASMRRASWASYQAKSTVGVPAVARSQLISTTRSRS